MFTPAHAVTVCYCCYCCSAVSTSKKCQNPRVKPENTLVFPGIFGYLPALDALGDRRGSLVGLPYCLSSGLTLATVVRTVVLLLLLTLATLFSSQRYKQLYGVYTGIWLWHITVSLLDGLVRGLLRQGEQPNRRRGRGARLVRWCERGEAGLLVVEGCVHLKHTRWQHLREGTPTKGTIGGEDAAGGRRARRAPGGRR